MKTLWALILFATIGFVPKEAIACSCIGDPPFENELRIGNGIIPGNSRGLGWHFTRAEQAGPLEEIVSVTRIDKPALDDEFVIEPIAFPSGLFENDVATLFAIRPNEWEVGARFKVSIVFESEEFNTNERHFVSGIFEIGEPLVSFPEEISIGLVGIDTIQLPAGSSCDFKARSAIAVINIARLSGVNLANLYFETFVDDELYEQTSSLCEYVAPGRNWYRPGRYWPRFDSNLLAAICDPENDQLPGLTPGTHTVQIRVTIPGTDIFFDTLPADVELACPEESSNDMVSGNDVGMNDMIAGDTADTKGETDGGCTSIRSPIHPIGVFLFVIGILRIRRR